MSTSVPARPVTPLNLAVLCGPCSTAPEVRVLESGARLATLAIRCPALPTAATSVPVTVWDPPAWIDTLEADEVVVVGADAAALLPASGGVGSRVDVEAELRRPGPRPAPRRRPLRRALGALEALG